MVDKQCLPSRQGVVDMVDNAHSRTVDNKVYTVVDKRKTIKIHSNTQERLRTIPEDTDNARIELLIAFYRKHKEGDVHV